MADKKKIAAGGAVVAGIALGGPAFIGAAALVMVLIIAIVVSAISGGLGAMFADKNIQQQYGLYGCTDPGGTAVPVQQSQKEYVRTVIGIAKTMHVSEQGQVIAVMVMFQESGIQNYANSGLNVRGYSGFPAPGTEYWLDVAKLSLKYPHDAVGNDADSVGLFQQRASVGWADDSSFKAQSNPDEAIKRLLDPRWTAQQFFGGPGGSENRGLLDVTGWESLPPTVAAQKVQGSAFPDAYAKWESQATALVRENQDAPAVALLSSGGSPTGDSSGVEWPMKAGTYTLTSGFGPRTDPVNGGSAFHNGQDMAAPLGTPIYTAASGTVVAAGPASGFGNWVVIDHTIDGKKYSMVYGHMPASSITVKQGDTVTMGQQIASVGTEGKSTGPHLHWEIWEGGRFDGGQPIDPKAFMEAGGHTASDVGTNTNCQNGDLPETTATGTVAAVLAAGVKYLGTPYSWGGGTLTGPSEGFAQGAGIIGFDCSSLMRYMIYTGTNQTLTLPRTAQEQYNATAGSLVPVDQLQPGDLMFWGSSGTFTTSPCTTATER
jgi:murein DD-endopeptidase MepM/ murein hydrolase activator NlpD